MIRHEWRVSFLDGVQVVRLSGQGIWLGDEIKPWSALTDAAFSRRYVRGIPTEELWLWFGPQDRRRLLWIGRGRQRAAWRAMLVDFAGHAGRRRPDLALRDGPVSAENRVASRIGLAVSILALTIMAVVLYSGPSFVGGLAAVWIGGVGGTVGGVIWGHYARRPEPPRIDWVAFAAREGQPGELPEN